MNSKPVHFSLSSVLWMKAIPRILLEKYSKNKIFQRIVDLDLKKMIQFFMPKAVFLSKQPRIVDKMHI